MTSEEKLLQDGWQCYMTGEVGRAQEICQELLSIAPTLAEAWFLSGILKFHTQRFEEAATSFHKTIALEPTHLNAYLNLGMSLGGLNQLDEATDMFRKVLELDQDNETALTYLGAISKLQGKIDTALAYFSKLAEKIPMNPQPCLEMAQIYYELGSWQEAETKYREVLNRVEDHFDGHLGLAVLLSRMGRFKESINHCHEAIRIQPKDFRPHQLLGNLLLEMRKLEDAKISLLRAASLSGEKSAEIYFNLGKTKFELCDFDGAIEDLNKFRKKYGALDNRSDYILSPNISTRDWSKSANAKSFEIDKPYSLGPTTLSPLMMEVPDAKVLGGDWLVMSKSNTLLVDGLVQFPETYPAKSRYIHFSSESHLLVEMPKQHHEIADAGFLLGGNSNYYHWLVDHVPRLAALECLSDGHSIPLIINNDLVSFQREALDLLGISDSRILALEHTKALMVKKLFVPAGLTCRTVVHPLAINWLRRVFLERIGDSRRAMGKRIFVSRRDASARKLRNEDEILEALMPYGFELIVPSALSLVEQIRAFSSAEIVIGAHGAGLTNILFCPHSAKIVDLKHAEGADFFETLAGELGFSYHAVTGERIKDPKIMPHFQDYVVDSKLVVKSLQQLMM